MMSALDYIWSVRDKQSSSFNDNTKIYELLTHFGIPSKVVRESSSALSGGQKARVVLAGLCTQRPHLLILDEPTNHLDIDSIQALANSINENEECAFMIITHDPQLINELERAQIMVLRDGKLEDYDGDMDDYKTELLEEMEF
jgi:ATP-binding cassette subfamily F protein 3